MSKHSTIVRPEELLIGGVTIMLVIVPETVGILTEILLSMHFTSSIFHVYYKRFEYWFITLGPMYWVINSFFPLLQ